MGLIRSATTAFSSTLGDQWKEYFICDSLSNEVICQKGRLNTSEKSSNKKGSSDVISEGSVVVVNEGQAIIIVDNGEIVDFSAEVGIYQFSDLGEPTIYAGGLGKGVVNSFKTFATRFTFGGDSAHNTLVYYFNLKELYSQKFGTPAPVPYADPFYQNIDIRFFGQASLKLVDPLLFYKNVSGNVSDEFKISDYWEMQLKSEFLMNLSEALSKLAIEGVSFNQIPQQQVAVAKHMNEVLDSEWNQKRGLEVESVGITSITLSPEDRVKVDKFDEMKVMSNTQNAAGRLNSAYANALEGAAENEGGSLSGFAGLNFASNASSPVSDITQLAQQERNSQNSNNANNWKCSCGAENNSKFCTECGKEKVESNKWQCSCGIENSSNFCSECGKEKVESNKWQCSCGTENSSKFCTECGQKKG